MLALLPPCSVCSEYCLNFPFFSRLFSTKEVRSLVVHPNSMGEWGLLWQCQPPVPPSSSTTPSYQTLAHTSVWSTIFLIEAAGILESSDSLSWVCLLGLWGRGEELGYGNPLYDSAHSRKIWRCVHWIPWTYCGEGQGRLWVLWECIGTHSSYAEVVLESFKIWWRERLVASLWCGVAKKHE